MKTIWTMQPLARYIIDWCYPTRPPIDRRNNLTNTPTIIPWESYRENVPRHRKKKNRNTKRTHASQYRAMQPAIRHTVLYRLNKNLED